MVTLTRELLLLGSVTYSYKKMISLMKMQLNYKALSNPLNTMCPSQHLDVILDSFLSLISLETIFTDFHFCQPHISPVNYCSYLCPGLSASCLPLTKAWVTLHEGSLTVITLYCSIILYCQCLVFCVTCDRLYAFEGLKECFQYY